MPIATASKAQSLGTKRNCNHCSARFYDFGKDEPTCPKCHQVVAVEPQPEPPESAPPPDATDSDDRPLDDSIYSDRRANW